MIYNAKVWLRDKILSNKWLLRLYYDHLLFPKTKLQKFLHYFGKTNKNVFIVQIGANDGRINDPYFIHLRRNNWSGLLIEPQKDVFEKLLRLYSSNANIKLENVAIDSSESLRVLYKISFTDKRWASGLSSFLLEDLQKAVDSGYVEKRSREDKITIPDDKSSWITSELIKTTTLSNLIIKHKMDKNKIDLIAIDTEGYDFEILKSIDFNHIKPKVVIYEYTHLSEQNLIDSQAFMINFGYKIEVAESDIICYLPSSGISNFSAY